MKHDPSLEPPAQKVGQATVIFRRTVWFLFPIAFVVGAVILLNISQRPTPPNYHMTFAIQGNRTKVMGVNLAGWLVLDKNAYPKSDLLSGAPTDVKSEYDLVSWYNKTNKKSDMVAKFDKHRASWITEDDIKAIVAAKLNTVRVPIGWWITDKPTPGLSPSEKVYPEVQANYGLFAPGAATYLDTLVKVWAKTYNISVLIDITSAYGGQSQDPSASNFGKYDIKLIMVSYNSTQDLVKFLVNRYKDDDGFLGIGLLNEPDLPILDREREALNYYRDTYSWVRNATKRPILTTMSALNQQHAGGSMQITDSDFSMQTFSIWPEAPSTVVGHWQEWHKIMKADSSFTNMDDGLAMLKNDITGWKGEPLFIGAWNGVKYGNNSVSDPASVKKMLDVVNLAPKGWVFHNWKSDASGWSLKDMLAQGVQVAP
ncbi:Aste57867_22887 [Aphanomyces stellatus]|uniref:glucan 1,3-beta-glucosidase n=1 Tax=Aphanomyces stellatus TaxID=120398 RepID=A0A485LLD6_9STRA|nr:hypothetical protein As57867_022816 [Aphanomyces stellatus]VFT99537.1 Aste57867_22887 [Aphanomyces stellatus]